MAIHNITTRPNGKRAQMKLAFVHFFQPPSLDALLGSGFGKN